MKKSGGSESTIIIGPSKSVLVYALHSLENVLGLARFRVFVPNMYVLGDSVTLSIREHIILLNTFPAESSIRSGRCDDGISGGLLPFGISNKHCIFHLLGNIPCSTQLV